MLTTLLTVALVLSWIIAITSKLSDRRLIWALRASHAEQLAVNREYAEVILTQSKELDELNRRLIPAGAAAQIRELERVLSLEVR
jgi:cell division protein FtsL